MLRLNCKQPGYLVQVLFDCVTFSSEIKMNNSNDSMSFIALNKLKHETYSKCCSQLELKLTDFPLLDAHTLPIHGTAWRGVCMCFLQCVCATSSIEDKNKPIVMS